MSARQIVAGGLLGAGLVGFGFLGGVVASAFHFDGQRAAILSKLDDASTRVHAHLMRLERDEAQSPEPRDGSNEATRAR